MLKTSRPAWRIWPDFSASIIAASSTMAPRAVLTRITPGFIASMQARETSPRVSSFKSRWIDTTSLSVNSSSRPTNSLFGCLFGDRRSAITLEQMHLDAELAEIFRVHVAARAGAEEHRGLQAGALLRNVGR